MTKRSALVVIAATAIVCSTAFTPGHADSSGYSNWCTDGVGTEAGVLDYPVTLSVETSTFNGGEQHTLVCWSSSPRSGSEPEASGGNLRLITYPNGSTTLECLADRGPSTVFALDCKNDMWVGDPDPGSVGNSVTGSSQFAWTSPTPIGQTGAESGDIGTSASGGFAGFTASRTCLYVLGTQYAPTCGNEGPSSGVNWADAADVDNTGSQCLVRIEPSSCTLEISRSYVVVGGDPRPTVDIWLAGTNVRYDLTPGCFGFCP